MAAALLRVRVRDTSVRITAVAYPREDLRSTAVRSIMEIAPRSTAEDRRERLIRMGADPPRAEDRHRAEDRDPGEDRQPADPLPGADRCRGVRAGRF